MKFATFICSLLLVLGLLTACNGVSTASKIEPGDKIGDFTITTGVQGSFTYGFAVECSAPGQDNSYTCNANTGDVINVSTGLRGSTGSANLDAIWANSSYQLFIDDRPVNLAAFGTIDYNHPTAGMIRFGNVVITTDNPGSITVRDAGIYDNGDRFSSISTYIFLAP